MPTLHGRRDARRYGCGSGRSRVANFCGSLRLFALVLETFLFDMKRTIEDGAEHGGDADPAGGDHVRYSSPRILLPYVLEACWNKPALGRLWPRVFLGAKIK